MNNPRPLRVVLICPYSLSAFGGVQFQVLGLARALRARGVDVRVMVPHHSDVPVIAPLLWSSNMPTGSVGEIENENGVAAVLVPE